MNLLTSRRAERGRNTTSENCGFDIFTIGWLFPVEFPPSFIIKIMGFTSPLIPQKERKKEFTGAEVVVSTHKLLWMWSQKRFASNLEKHFLFTWFTYLNNGYLFIVLSHLNDIWKLIEKKYLIYFSLWNWRGFYVLNEIMWQINLDSYESYLIWPQSSYQQALLALDPTSKLFGVCPTNFAPALPRKGQPLTRAKLHTVKKSRQWVRKILIHTMNKMSYLGNKCASTLEKIISN